jgi:hypothetical protein
MHRFLVVSVVLVLAAAAPSSGQDDPKKAIHQLTTVAREGQRNPEMRQAWQKLVDQGPPALPVILQACNDADAIAANWLRNAFDVIAEAQLASGKPLPIDSLRAYLENVKNSPKARRMVYEWLCHVDAATPDRYLPTMLQDPSVELRRDAVARFMADGQKKLDNGAKDQAVAIFKKSLEGARDRDQVDAIAKQLKTLTGEVVDVTAHFGFIRQWHVIGPFEWAEGKGFATSYPVESTIELGREETGKANAKVKWSSYETKDPYGLVDLNKAVAKHNGAVAYAFTTVRSEKSTPVEVRLGSNNAVKVWLNGELVIAHEEYHHNGGRVDQYVGKAMLRPGANTLLVKVCQNEQKEEWAQSWSLQLRLCDSVGGGVPFQVITNAKE